MNRELIALLKQGVTVWNSQRPRLAAPPEIRAEYEQYARRIAEAEAAEHYGYEYRNVVSYEAFLLRRGGRVDFIRAELRGMDLRGYDLSYCALTTAQLGGADLRGANLHKCSLVSANISGADLRGAQIQHASLSNAIVSDALLEPVSYEALRADRRRSRYMRGIFFTGCPSLSLDEWGAILDEYHRRCAYCGDFYELMDHFILRSKGGQTWVGNVVPACLACWHAKGDWPRPSERVIPAEVMGRVAADLQRRAQSHIDHTPAQ